MSAMLADAQLLDQVRALVSEIIEVPASAIHPDEHLVRDLGADSMKAIEIMSTLERRFSIVIPPEELPKMATLAQIHALVRSLVGGA